MRLVLITLGLMLQIVIIASVVLYSPFAKRLTYAMGVLFALTFFWGLLRVTCILAYRESSPPLMGFLVAPFVAGILGGGARVLMPFLLQIPVVGRIVHKARTRFSRKNTQPPNP